MIVIHFCKQFRQVFLEIVDNLNHIKHSQFSFTPLDETYTDLRTPAEGNAIFVAMFTIRILNEFSFHRVNTFLMLL